ncbi:MAG TPA: GNAT family N-acetyltransferase [Steroidobacteraceae bacterium]|nr:GNAT family N-acetyltransferase [Steroidobacteraceae bacterium]
MLPRRAGATLSACLITDGRLALLPILTTARLELRPATLEDAAFFLRLLNEPSWLENIGDRGVRTLADAEGYIRNNIWVPYQAHGFGLHTVLLKSSPLPIGLCGLLKRDFLAAPDLGFALLPEFCGLGLATEAARAVLSHAQAGLGIGRLYAIVKPGNQRSVRLLEQLGFRHEGPCQIPQGDEVELFQLNA